MANVQRRGDRWRVRWKERIGTDPRGRPIWRDRSRTTTTKRAADQLAREIEDASALGRTWSPASEREVVDVRDGYAAYLEHLVRAGRSKAKFDAVGAAVGRVWELLGAQDGRPLPVTLLNREVLVRLWTRIVQTEQLAPSTGTRRVRELEQFWQWMHDAELPGVPLPRRLPDLPSRVAVESPAPTWSEVDAVIRRLVELQGGWGPAARAAWLSRCTGLRISSSLALCWEHLDLARRELHVPPRHPGAKTRLEQRGWTAPLAPALVEVLVGWGGRSGALCDGEDATRQRVKVACTRAWSACEEAGEVRRVVWAPPGRSRRPTHAFRAAWKAGLAVAGVSWETRQALVAGSRGSDAAYVDGGSLPREEAVATIPVFHGSR